MAVWCTCQQGLGAPSYEVHLNYWRVAGRKRKGCVTHSTDFLEIGILIQDPQSINLVNIFTPKSLKNSHIFDLGSRFLDPHLAQGIFNENLRCSGSGSGSSWIELQTKNQDLFCRVHSFAKDRNERIDTSELELEEIDGGTLIKILPRAIASSADKLGSGDRLYFRLRLLMGDRKGSPFVKVIAPSDRKFQSGFEEIEYIDFRINESRTLPDTVNRKMQHDITKGIAPLNVIAFLAAVPVSSALSVSHTQFHKNRILEDVPWTNYAPNPLPEGMVVYHWKKVEPEIESFAAFVKLQTRKSGWGTIFWYLFIAFIFGVAGNLSASALQYYAGLFQDTPQKALDGTMGQQDQRSG